MECWGRRGRGGVSFFSLFGSIDLSAVPRSLLSKTNAEPDGHLMCGAISCQSACGNKAGAVLLKTPPPHTLEERLYVNEAGGRSRRSPLPPKAAEEEVMAVVSLQRLSGGPPSLREEAGDRMYEHRELQMHTAGM